MKLIILGCGYIGYNLYLKLSKNYKCECWGLNNYYSNLCEDFKEIDIFNYDYSNLDLENTILIDCISLISNVETDYSLIDKTIIKYNKFYEKIKKVNKYIFLSSGGAIYGNSYIPVDELASVNPINVYALSKLKLEELIKEKKLNYLIIRLSNPYGGIFDENKNQGIVDILINKSLKEEVFTLWGDDKTIRDYINMEDFTTSILKLIQNNISNEIINVGSSKAISIREIINLVEKYTLKKIKINIIEKDIPKIDSIILSIDKLKKLIDFDISIDIEEGIKLEVKRKMEGV